MHSESRYMPYRAEQMYALIADIEAYPHFLPWCTLCRIRKDKRDAKGRGIIDADLMISFKVFREQFGSRVTFDPDSWEINVVYLDGPFNHLLNKWRFTPKSNGCIVDFHVDFELRNRTLQKIIGVAFGDAIQRIVRAFEDRAAELYVGV